MPRPPAILIVEPDPDTRQLYRLSLGSLAADVEEATDGAQALAKALLMRPDVVVTELRMPRIDGYALCSMLRADEQTRNAAVLVVTANGSAEVIRTAHTRGFDAVLVKPCSPASLASTVGELLRSQRQRPSGSPRDVVQPEVELGDRPRTMSRACARGKTVAPLTPPPPLHCPRCDAALQYEHTQIGGVNDHFAERWDYFLCDQCGPFQDRHRTRKLRAVEGSRQTA